MRVRISVADEVKMGLSQFVARRLARSMAEDDAKFKSGQTLPSGVVVREFAYCGDGHAMHRLNVCLPETARGVLPLIVDIHGGAWVFGDKDLNLNLCMHLAAKGYCVVAPSYRLVPEVTLDEQIKDIFSALDFAAKHAEEWGADASQTMLTGDSAGGHLSSLALCICLDDALAKRYGVTPPPMTFSCLVMSHPVPEIHTILRNENGEPSKRYKIVQKIFDGAMFGRRPRRHTLFDISAFSEYSEGVHLPPVMLIGCERDTYVGHSRCVSKSLQDKVERGECDRFVLRFTDAAHEKTRLCHVYEVMYPDLPDSEATIGDMLRFFDDCRFGVKDTQNDGVRS